MSLKVRLAVMNFLEFAVWGAYLTCMGNYLGVAGLGDKISWFYAIQGIVSIFMPTLMGIVADRYIQPQRMLGLCHLLAGGFMLGCWWLGHEAGVGQELTSKTAFIILYTLSVAFYMPTIALSNTVAFTALKNNGMDTVEHFPPIRVVGTIGFIVTMWFVNCAVWEAEGPAGDDMVFTMSLAENPYKFQYTYMQFFVSAILSFVLFLYCFTLRDAGRECLQVVQAQADSSVLYLLGITGHVSASDQWLCRSFHHELQGDARILRHLCSQQCDAVDLDITNQRGALHSHDTFLPEALWHQGSHAHVDVCLGAPFRILWHWQSSHAGSHHLHPVVHRLWRGFRLLQCVGRHLCPSGVRAQHQGFSPRALYDDDEWYRSNSWNPGCWRGGESLLPVGGGIPDGRLADVLVHLLCLLTHSLYIICFVF